MSSAPAADAPPETEVAELLGMNRSEVNNHVHRGLTHLRAVTIADPLLKTGPRPTHEEENIT